MKGHVYKRGESWTYVFDIARDSNGRRRQVSKGGFRTRKQAQTALREALHAVDRGEFVEPSAKTLAEFLERDWLPSIPHSVRPTTVASYTTHVRTHIVPRIGHIRLQRLTPADVQRLHAELLEKGRADGAGGLSSGTVRLVHATLHRALRDASRWGLAPRNVAEDTQPPKPRPPEMKTWDAEQLRSFLDGIRDDRLYALWLLAALTGMRRGELVALRWADVDLQAGTVSVRRSAVPVRGQILVGEPKTARGRRSIALDERTVSALTGHRRAQLEERLAAGEIYVADDLVFAHEDGSMIHPGRLSTWFNRHGRRIGLPAIRLHDLRHTHASLALAAGVHPKVVSERLGHSSIAMTLDLYSHSVPALQAEAAERIAALLAPAKTPR